ncbi:MAG: hypothetical protein KTR19_12655 [Hyphomicrobiales bacterium]|nr:hypothetical protein [Hyphomicrobiales bacterium]
MSLIKGVSALGFGRSAVLCAFMLVWSSGMASAQNRAEFCNEYAESAVDQNKANTDRDCNFNGPRWSNNRTRHFAWCMLFPRQAEAEQDARKENLRECRQDARRERRKERRREAAGKRASCDTYAKTTMVQAEANRKYECGYKGGEWRAKERPHFRWCMGARRKYLADEIRYRQAQLQKCFDKLGDYDDERNDRGYRQRRF